MSLWHSNVRKVTENKQTACKRLSNFETYHSDAHGPTSLVAVSVLSKYLLRDVELT